MAMEQEQVVRQLLVERDKLFAYIWAIVRDDHLAEDVFQDVSLLAMKKADEIDGPDHLPHWLRATARHRALYAIRQRGGAPILDDNLLDQMESDWRQFDPFAADDMTDALRHCLSRLSPDARRLIEMRYRESIKPAGIAQRLGRKVTTVYVTLTRAHRSLGDCIRHRLAHVHD
ncbi:sigma-70 family RNA polymerase sigma factor [Planctomycetales bacterium ZRK34]|nr:sigma-70 family RNA polymerase sigma factor [Planctomycetales bacterium ZRK34]